MKRMISFLLALLVCGSLCLPVSGESYTGRPDMQITLTAAEVFDSNIADWVDHTPAMEPGDDIQYRVQVNNESTVQTEWYMKNLILRSLEDGSIASDGAYSYRLAYVSGAGVETVLFESDTVGGTGDDPAGIGLHAAEDALKDYFYFASIAPGESGAITLHVALEGESQGNDYQDTLAKLQMNLAVAFKNGTDSRQDEVTVVKTGDTSRPFPFFVAMAVSGLVLLILPLIGRIRRRRKGEATS